MIVLAYWINGRCKEWNSKEKRLKRLEMHGLVQGIVLKKLENVENATKNWLEEVFIQKVSKLY